MSCAVLTPSKPDFNMGAKLYVHMAVDSMLYSPVFYALCLVPELREHVVLEPVRKPLDPGADPWLTKVLGTGSYAIGIGDPMRLTAADTPTAAEPLGVLIKKLCLWVMDHEYQYEWLRLKSLVVHPRGMTGFAAAAYGLSEHLRQSSGCRQPEVQHNEIEHINARLYDKNVDPNHEIVSYDRIRRGKRRWWQREAPGTAGFVTANPLYVNHQRLKLSELYCFARDYREVVMTAILGRAQADSEERAIRQDFVAAVAYACRKLQEDPGMCAFRLWNEWPRIYAKGSASPEGFETRLELFTSIQWLANTRVYNCREDLKVSAQNLEETCKIRRRIEPLLSSCQRRHDLEIVRNLLLPCVA
jgi:hypothetical protein